MKKPEKMVLCASILIVILMSIYVAHANYRSQTWESKEVRGIVKEFQLYNDFPNLEVFIYFTDASYLHVTSNPFWTYSQLINLNLTQPITVHYKINLNHKIRVTNIEGFYE